MIRIRPSEQRGHAYHGWLEARHSFSFAEYHDPEEMGWGPLRVINEDRIAPASGFGRHGHRDMEIITVILSGELAHQDSLGHHGVIRRGEVQRMSAGKGILHSEVNPSPDTPTHLLQIWIEPSARGFPPSYEQQPMPVAQMHQRWQAIASPDGHDGSATIHQDARLFATRLHASESIAYTLPPGRLAYVHLIYGELSLNGHALRSGDGAKIADESELQFLAEGESELLLFDLPPTNHP